MISGYRIRLRLILKSRVYVKIYPLIMRKNRLLVLKGIVCDLGTMILRFSVVETTIAKYCIIKLQKNTTVKHLSRFKSRLIFSQMVYPLKSTTFFFRNIPGGTLYNKIDKNFNIFCLNFPIIETAIRF